MACAAAGCQQARSAAPASLPPAAQSAALVIVAKVVGEVTSSVRGQRTALRFDQQVVPGATIETSANSSVVLVFSNGAVIHLAAGSALEIAQFSQEPFSGVLNLAQSDAEPTTSVTRLKLLRGELVGRVKQLNRAGGSSFQIETPVGNLQPTNSAVKPSPAPAGAPQQATAPIRAATVSAMQGATMDFGGGRSHAIFRVVFRAAAAGAAYFQLSTAIGAVEFSSASRPGVVVSEGREIIINVAVSP